MALVMPRAEAMAAALPGCGSVVKIPGAAHAANLTHPGLCEPAAAGVLAPLPA